MKENQKEEGSKESREVQEAEIRKLTGEQDLSRWEKRNIS